MLKVEPAAGGGKRLALALIHCAQAFYAIGQTIRILGGAYQSGARITNDLGACPVQRANDRSARGLIRLHLAGNRLRQDRVPI